METLNMNSFFPSAVYFGHDEKFLADARKVADKHFKKLKLVDDIYPIMQTDSITDELLPFATSVAQMSWDILKSQGYAMDNLQTYVSEMWAQHFEYRGQHIEHVHNFGAQITGFYFLEVPKDSTYPLIHDPNHAKRQIKLAEANENDVTLATSTINFSQIKAGDIILFNSWLPHSFAPNRSKKPFRFIHFNVGVTQAPPQSNECEAAEIV